MTRIKVVGGIILAFVPVSAWLVTVLPAAAAERQVSIVTGNRFEPREKFIVAGDTVVWKYDDANGAEHSVTRESSPERFDSSPNNCPSFIGESDCLSSTNREYSHRFNTPGVFSYFCKVHGSSMTGTIHVAPRESTPTPSPTRTTPSASPSPSPSGSVTGSPTASGSPIDSPTPSPSVDGSPSPTPLPSPDGSDGSAVPRVALALVALGSLGGAGFLIYRRFLA